MKLTKLKERISNYQNGIIYNADSSFVSLLVIERYFKKKFREYLDKTAEFTRYLKSVTKVDIDSVTPQRIYDGSLHLEIKGIEKNNKIFSKRKEVLRGHNIDIDFKSLDTRWEIEDYYNPTFSKDMFKEDTVVREYIEYLTNFIETYDMSSLRSSSSVGLFVDMYFDTSSRVFAINISDNSSLSFAMPRPFDRKAENVSEIEDKSCNFYYFKNVLEGDVGLAVDYKTARNSQYLDALSLVYPHVAVGPSEFRIVNEEAGKFLDRDLLDVLYSCMKVDSSGFSKSVREELRQIEIANRTQLSDEMKNNLTSLKEQQIAKLMKAYQLIKEATNLLDGIKSTVDFELIKLENLSSVVFKNGGNLGKDGCIEFEEFFKNNAILRMLDLSELDLTNVDIRGMDFSGTNVHIDPQRIFAKDMTNVNATGVKFSPFTDSFEGVILDGAIITDKEANIDLNTVDSYDNRTVVKSETIITIM